ncbi:MAG: hypothetical protein IJ550_02215 [Bacteroidaceae bacterium]|nr:hypothetical protein [Bacteroidaceae bacterium]
MRLKHVTFTGVDERTDLDRLQEIQKQYPYTEWGILTSYHWYENGNRYLSPQIIDKLRGRGLNMALHVCGSAAHDAAKGKWNKIRKHTLGCLWLFNRVQLNVANRQDNPLRMSSTPSLNTELIIQQRPNKTTLYEDSKWIGEGNVSMLLDASGGKGIDTPIVLYPSDGKIGYAGGINPDNVEEKMSFLLSHVTMGEFWIDMESGVRTNDWFDLDKVERVLQICDRVIGKYVRT